MQPESAPLPNAFEVLGLPVSPWVERETLRSQFVTLAAQWHPDTNPDPEAGAQFQSLVGAHLLLSDPVKRLECVLRLERPSIEAPQPAAQLSYLVREFFMLIVFLIVYL